MIIIFPRRGSMGSRARMRPSGVNSSLVSRASSSGKSKCIPAKLHLVLCKASQFIYFCKTVQGETRGRTSKGVFSLDNGIQRRRLDRFGQKMANSTEPEQLNAEGHLMQRGAKDLWSHVGLQSREHGINHVNRKSPRRIRI